ncbi:ABC transporter permease [Cohnella herbarum]|uniref:Sugar ABC transporter permease n=1 Tax=Cohnella herbarum TaxID=2728023 RepID=A0A7Z2VKJ0_9BACL|nr:ABC transporter permease subunit [Cohnella herbarum]QJD84569.1 sugar ABC transporter permease [Cohnella herbarum]
MSTRTQRWYAPLYQLGKQWQLTLMLVPLVVLVLLFLYVPMGFLVIAFKDYNIGKGVWDSPWVGWGQFEKIFTYSDITRLIRNSLVISFLTLISGFAGPIVLALLFNEMRGGKFRKLVQTVSYLPHFFPWTIIAGMILMFFSIDGVVNGLLESWGSSRPVQFLTDHVHFIQLLVASNLWKEIGWGTIIYIAAIAGINPSLYEAAVVDGAGRYQRMRYVTIPGMRPAIGISLIFAAGSLMSVNFDQIYNLYNPQVYEWADVIDTYVVRAGVLQMQYSQTAAIGLFKGLVGLVLIVLSNWLVRRATDNEYSLF